MAYGVNRTLNRSIYPGESAPNAHFAVGVLVIRDLEGVYYLPPAAQPTIKQSPQVKHVFVSKIGLIDVIKEIFLQRQNVGKLVAPPYSGSA